MEVGWGGDEGGIRMGIKMEGKEWRWVGDGDGEEVGVVKK